MCLAPASGSLQVRPPHSTACLAGGDNVYIQPEFSFALATDGPVEVKC